MPTEADAVRFWAKVTKGGDCWIWNGTKDGKGYGRLHLSGPAGRRTVKAHRLAYELHKGPIPSGLEILHACDNPSCVNPAHLSVGTRADNMQDAAAKGRICTIGKSRFTHCPQGHPYSGANLYVAPNGHRKCRECTRIQQRESYLRLNPAIVQRGPRSAIRGGQ
jgi:hypothetical protein